MSKVKAYAAQNPSSPLAPWTFERRVPGPNDVVVQIAYCGVCHSDIHQARDEWGGGIFPMVPGHEIVGKVTHVGKRVKKFKVGDIAGVGCFVDSCRKCGACKASDEQYCEVHTAYSYNGVEMDKKTPTYGGYSSEIVVDEKYTLKVSKKLPLDRVAPLLCAGITTYSPLKRHGVKRGMKVAVAGLGGLGHMAVKLAVAMGAEVTVLSTSPAKEKDAKRLGAKGFIVTKDLSALEKAAGRFDFILDTISADHDLGLYIALLKRRGAMVLVGVPPKPVAFQAMALVAGGKRVTGSLIGGLKETQEMLDFCARKNVVSDIERIPMSAINEAYERTLRGDVKFRFVVDMSTL